MSSFIPISNVSELMKGARKIVTQCAQVKPNERVLIITDTGRDLAIGYALMKSALEVGAEATIITMKERETPGEEPPPQVREAMLVSDVILQTTSTIMYYTQAKIDACKKGARFAAMTAIVPEVLVSPAVTDTNFEKQKPIVEKLTKKLTVAKKVKIITPRGTNLELGVEGRVAENCTAILDAPGTASGVPDIEVYIAPMESSVNGVAVIDGTISSSGLVKNSIKLFIKNGIVQKIENGEDAKKLRNTLKSQNDPSVYQVAELGIGLNPNAQLKGAIIEDEGALGTVHIALGDNHRFGGKNKAPIHIDLVMKNPTLEFDGKIVLKGKEMFLYRIKIF